MTKIDHSLFSAHEHALQEAFGLCPECNAKLQIRHGKSGAFIGCSQYPQCHFSKPLHETQTTELKRIDGSHCPECGSQLAIKKGRYGLFIGCSNFPQCHHIEPVKQKAEATLLCPVCNKGHLAKRTNKFGKVFYACNDFPKCKYLLNHPPIEITCPKCQWPIMCSKKLHGREVYQCPQKSCQHTVEANS